MTTYGPTTADHAGRPSDTRSDVEERSGLRHDRFARPVAPPLEALAIDVDDRLHGPWRAPIAVAAAGYLAGALLLVLFGWLIVHSGVGEPIRNWDQSISEDLATGRTSGWSDYSDLGTSGANTYPVVAGMVLVSAVLAALRRWRDLLFLPLALGLELSIFLTVNYIVARDRPDVAQLGGEPGTHSFPSGHVAATLVLWAGIAILLGIGRWRTPFKVLGWALVALPVLSVAFSRVYRGMHFTTDVLAGLVLGLFALAMAVTATRASWLGSRREPSHHARRADR